MITLNSLSFLGKPQAGIRRSVNATPQQISQAKPAQAQDVFFSGHGDKDKKLHQSKLVLDRKGLRFEPASKWYYRKELDALIAKDADLNQPYQRFGKPILHDLAYAGHDDLVLKAIGNGASLRTMDSQHATALHSAARGGHRDVVETLLVAGAPVDKKDINGNRAVHAARHAGHTEVADLLDSYSRFPKYSIDDEMEF